MKNIIDNQQGTLNAYVAGLWDGEGTFSLTKYVQRNKKTNTRVCIAVTNTDLGIIQTVIDFLKKYEISFHLQVYDRKKTGRRIQYQIEITKHKNKIKFIDLVYDYLTKNKEYAKLFKEFCIYKQEAYDRWRMNGGNGGCNRKYRPPRNPKDIQTSINEEIENEFYLKYRALRDASETTSQTLHEFDVG